MPSAAARFLTIDSAACALSFITSPSWPVRISLPEPGMRVASMNRISPPTGVQARPVATPGTLVRIAISLSNFGAPRMATRSSRVMRIGPLLPFGDAHGGVAQRLADLALEAAHAGFARVALDDVAQRIVGDLDLARLEPVRLHLPAHQIAMRDLELLVGGVAGEADDLHAVAQRSGNGVEHVGRGDEHHPAQIERHREIIVAERVVLLGIEHFEQRRAGIALDAGAELVDLVEHHDAVARAGLADRLDDVARQRADIGAAMAADFRLVMHAAED